MGYTGIHKGRGNELLFMCGCAVASPLAYAVCSYGLSHAVDLSGTVGVVAPNFGVGGLIGGVILIWRLAVAAWCKGFFRAYCVTRARRFRILSAACLRVIRFAAVRAVFDAV